MRREEERRVVTYLLDIFEGDREGGGGFGSCRPGGGARISRGGLPDGCAIEMYVGGGGLCLCSSENRQRIAVVQFVIWVFNNGKFATQMSTLR